MKAYKRIKIITLLLLVTIIIFSSFFGLYKKEEYHVVNLIKNFKLGMDFTDRRVINMKVDTETTNKVIYDSEGNIVNNTEEGTEYTEENGYKTVEEKVNSEDSLTKENYKKAEKIIKTRLANKGIEEYLIKTDNSKGTIVLEIPEDDNADLTTALFTQQGNFTVIDKDTTEVLLDNSHIKSSNVTYGATSETDMSEVTVYLQINFNEEGAKKLEEISQVYVSKTVKETNEEGTEEDKEEIKYVSVVIDGTTYSTTYFGEKMSTGVLYVPMTKTSNNEELKQAVDSLNSVSSIINNGKLPLTYTYDTTTLSTNISKNDIIYGLMFVGVILLIAEIYLVIKFKEKGFISVFLQIGFIGVTLLLIRYTNVIITLEGIAGIICATAINYILNYILLNKEEINYWTPIYKFTIKTIPVYIIAIVFSFMKARYLSSFGMTLLWGIIAMYVYNILITKTVLEMVEE